MLSIVFALLSGFLMALSQPPFNLGHLCWFCLVPLFIALNGKTLKQSLFLGFLAGIAYFSVLLYWVFPILPPATIFGGIVLICYMSLFFIAFCFCFQFCVTSLPSNQQRSAIDHVLARSPAAQLGGTSNVQPLLYAVAAAVLWTAFEYLRTLGVLGFPWGLMAYSQWKNTTLIQVADITGVYGVSFVIVLFNAALSYLVMQYKKPFKAEKVSNPGMAVLSIALFGVLIFVFFYGMKAISRYTQQGTGSSEINIAVVQGNIDQNEKWDQHYLGKSLGIYMGLTREIRQAPDLVIWPETAITISMNENPFLKDSICDFTKSTGSYLLSGVQEQENGKYYNRAVLITPGAEIAGAYDKIHLVPFGEMTPSFFKAIFPFLKHVVPGEDFTKGCEYIVFKHPKGDFSCCVCYESIFPDLVRRFAKNGALFLVNVTNDGWYGRSGAPYQHFSINAFRAVENRMEIARAANTGISGYIDKLGVPRYYTRIYTRGVIESKMSLRQNTTFYTRFGDVFSFACLIASLLFIIRLPAAQKKK